MEQARGILGIQTEAVVESIAPPIVVPPVVAGKGSEGIPIEPKAGGGYQAIIPLSEVADLLQVSRLDFLGEIPADSSASVETIAVNAVPLPPPNVLFVRTVDISIKGPDDTSSLPAAIEFHIMKQWLDDQSVSLDDVVLFRHKNEWTELPTTHSGSMVGSENQLYERFSAETPGFSIFAVGMGYDQAMSESVPTVVVQPTATEIPVVTSMATVTSTATVTAISTVVPDTPTAIAIPTAIVTPKPKPTAVPTRLVPVPVPTPTPTSIPTPTPVPLPTATPVPTKEPVASGPALKVSGETFRVGDAIIVTYAGMARKKDGWIGMFKPNDPDTTFKGYQKIGSEGSGSTDFVSPKQTGIYEFRLLSTVEGNPYNREAVSGKINVLAAYTPTPTATVTPTATPDRSGDVDGGRLDNNEPAKGSINYVGDSDDWNFNGTAGMGVTVSVKPSGNSDIDAYVELINSSGNLETQSGGAGGSTNAIISGWILQQSGQYTVRVSSASGTGAYTIEVSAIAAAEVILPTSTPTPLVIAVLPIPTATVTPTPVPPTATVTPTPVPPTATVMPTPLPPTATPTPSTSLGNIRGTVLYNGNPLSDYTDKAPSFWAREENDNTAPTIVLSYDTDTAIYNLADMQVGKYGIQVSLDNDGNGFPLPNDFYGWISPIYVEEGGVTVERDLEVGRILHLTSPEDNKDTLRRTDDPKHIYQGEEVKVEWDSIPEATQYRLSIYLFQESPYQSIENVVNQVTSNTTYIASLPASEDGQFYQLHLYADNANSDMVGQLMTRYENGMGWDYRFQTASAPTPTFTPTPVPPTATPTPVPPTQTPTPVPQGIQGEIRWGESITPDGQNFLIEEIRHFYSSATISGQRGYFYGKLSPLASPDLYLANFESTSSQCPNSGPGYGGLSSVEEAHNLATLQYFEVNYITFGAKTSSCYSGILAFRQGEYYGLLDPISIGDDGSLTFYWWAGDKGVTDFSNAPTNP